jgi:hypothetical protein
MSPLTEYRIIPGINYFKTKAELHGCINDVKNVQVGGIWYRWTPRCLLSEAGDQDALPFSHASLPPRIPVHYLQAFIMEQYGFSLENIKVLTDEPASGNEPPTRVGHGDGWWEGEGRGEVERGRAPSILTLPFAHRRDMTFVRIPQTNILDALRWLVEGATAGDSLFFHFSGHGGTARDLGTRLPMVLSLLFPCRWSFPCRLHFLVKKMSSFLPFIVAWSIYGRARILPLKFTTLPPSLSSSRLNQPLPPSLLSCTLPYAVKTEMRWIISTRPSCLWTLSPPGRSWTMKSMYEGGKGAGREGVRGGGREGGIE